MIDPQPQPDQILEGTFDGKQWRYRDVPPLERCPRCGYAQAAHTAADLSCPDEAQASAVWGR